MDTASGMDRRAVLQNALTTIDEMQKKMSAVERSRKEPIAVVGIGCRFPGGIDGPDSFWRLMRDGVDATREVPPDRWDIDAFYDSRIKADINSDGKVTVADVVLVLRLSAGLP